MCLSRVRMLLSRVRMLLVASNRTKALDAQLVAVFLWELPALLASSYSKMYGVKISVLGFL